jgi:spore coat protein CotH
VVAVSLLALAAGCGGGGVRGGDALGPSPDAAADAAAGQDAAADAGLARDGTGPDGALPPPADPFALDRVQSLHLTVTEAEWNALLHDFDQNPRNEVYRRARLVRGDDPATGAVFEDIGLRVRGNAFTRERPEVDGHGDGRHHADNPLRRVHWKLRLDERFDEDESVYGPPAVDLPERPGNRGREYGPGVRVLNLKFNNDDPTLLREVLSYDLFRRFGVPAPHAAFARLTLAIGDAAPRPLGVFVLVENVDEQWLARRGLSAPGAPDVLFKCLYQDQGPADLSRPDGAAGPDAGVIGVERVDPATPAEWPGFQPYRPSYDLKTDRDAFAAAEAALNDLVRLLAGAPDEAALDAALEAAIDVDALLRATAASVFLGMADDYWRLGNNYYLARRPDDGRWLFVPYDYDRTFGTDTVGPAPATSSFLGWGVGGVVRPVLLQRVLAIPRFRAAYLDAVAELVADGGPASEAVLRARAEELQALVVPSAGDVAALDPFPFDADLAPLLDYVRTRVAVARDELEAQR